MLLVRLLILKVNGKEVGSHVGGYTACIVDITEYIRKENLIEITVDNGRKDITPISADFTFGGGDLQRCMAHIYSKTTLQYGATWDLMEFLLVLSSE